MHEREAARHGGLPARVFRGTSFEMAGTGFGYRGNDLPPVALLQAASKSFFFFRKHSLAGFSESTCSLHSCRSGSQLEQRGCKPRGHFFARRMRRPAPTVWNAADGSL